MAGLLGDRQGHAVWRGGWMLVQNSCHCRWHEAHQDGQPVPRGWWVRRHLPGWRQTVRDRSRGWLGAAIAAYLLWQVLAWLPVAATEYAAGVLCVLLGLRIWLVARTW